MVGVLIANLSITLWEAALVGTDELVRPGSVGTTSTVVAGWALGSFVGALSAFMIARWDYAGFGVAGLVGLAGLANTIQLHDPPATQVAAVVLPFVTVLVAFGLYRRWRASRLHLSRHNRQ